MSELDRASERLREIAERLRAAEVSDTEAEALAREAADVLASASAELERALREAPGDRP